ncbi:MAG: hypothetical protein CM15mP107_0150 [Bacteroidota bacterium]|nr:MAG: hypothetical protein CM15mP107_0150 [Bacteroidota bacterium]
MDRIGGFDSESEKHTYFLKILLIYFKINGVLVTESLTLSKEESIMNLINHHQ